MTRGMKSGNLLVRPDHFRLPILVRADQNQTQQNNVPARSPKEYFKLAVFIPYLDCLIQQLDLRFSDLTIQGLRALCLIPAHLFKDDEKAIDADDLYKFYSDDLPFPQAFHQEIALWKTMWNNSPIKPNSLVTTIADRNASPTMFPNIKTIIISYCY